MSIKSDKSFDKILGFNGKSEKHNSITFTICRFQS